MADWEFCDGEWWKQSTTQRYRGVRLTCGRCDDEFVTRKVKTLPTCCKTCRLSYPRQRVMPRPCESCGNDFKPFRHETRFCSRRCRSDVLRGANHHAWKGGPSARGSYANVKVDPSDEIGWAMRYDSTNYVPEHRLVMARYLGRPLTRDEVVHHVNGLRYDNRLANLELWRTGHPMGQNVEDQVAWAREILERYGDFSQPSETNQ
jgi:hypothetical protein